MSDGRSCACSIFSNSWSDRNNSATEMDAKYFGVIELVFSFGVILLIAIQQLYSVNKAKKKRRERESAPESKPGDDG